MAEIDDLSTTDGSNTVTGWSEGMSPSNVNNAARADLGIIARYMQHSSGEGLVATTESGVNSLSVALVRASLTNTASASGSTGYFDGLSLKVTIPSTITSVALLGINGKKKHPFIDMTNTTLSSSAIMAGAMIDISFDASAKAWRMLNPSAKTDAKHTTVSVHLPEGSAASTAGSEGALYTKDTGGQPELFYREESDGDEIQMTSGGSLNVSLALPKNYLTGCQLSQDTDTDHDILVSAGECRGSDDDEDITTTAITKQIDATWSSGDDAGGLSSSITLAGLGPIWLHVHAIMVSGAADVGFDTSVTAANLVSDHSATAYRRLGSIELNGDDNIIAFKQYGDEFIRTVPVADYSADPGASEVTTTLSVPTGFDVLANISAGMFTAASNADYYTSIYHPDVTTPTPSTFPTLRGHSGASNDAARSSVVFYIRTNASAQIQHISDSGVVSVKINTTGWIDDRGKND